MLGKDTKAYCEKLAARLGSEKDLPASCLPYIQGRKDSKIDPFAGMGGGSSARAVQHAQVQRRLTGGSSRRFSKGGGK